MDHSKAAVVSVNPFRCRVWKLHDRLEEQVTERTCEVEIRSFEEHGQLIPALGRRLRDDPDYDVEIICGARRLFVARHINRPLFVELCEMSDDEAIVAMDMENRQRKDVSPYERGRSYARWLRAGCFVSQDELARSLRLSASQVSRLLKLARLPSAIAGAFNSPLDICEGWGLDLAAALEDPHRRQRTLGAARAIASLALRPPAHEIYRRLMAAGSGNQRAKRPAHDKVVKAENGTPLFRIKYQRNAVAFVFSLDKTPLKCLDVAERALAEILERYIVRSLSVVPDNPCAPDGERSVAFNHSVISGMSASFHVRPLVSKESR